MREVINILLVLSLVLLIAPVTASYSGLDKSNGVDLFRGAWVGKIDGTQINLYFGESVQIDDDSFKTSGYFSMDESGGKKRAKAMKLPMMVKITDFGGGIYNLIILANVIVPDDNGEPITTIMKLTGTAKIGGSGVTDDTLNGEWYLNGPDGKSQGMWSAVHLDRRNVKPPEIIPDPPLNFHGDLKIHLLGKGGQTPIEDRNPVYAFDVDSNIVMDSVRVTFPDGRSVILPPYTDVFSPDVDWVNQFRFCLNIPGLPMKGVPYTFTALDVAGNPIPKIVSTDVWVGVAPPDPPTNVQAIVTENGIQVSWNPVSPIEGSFDPDKKIGWYQMEINDNIEHISVYGANHIYTTDHLIPFNKEDFFPGIDGGLSLSEMKDGSYTLNVNVHSFAPEGSAGTGFEYSSRDSDEFIRFEINNGVIVIL